LSTAEEGVDLTNEQMLAFVHQNWSMFATMGYREYLNRGRGAICISFADATADSQGMFFNPFYIAENSPELDIRGGWPDDEGGKTKKLIETYDPTKTVVFIFGHKSGRLNTMFMGSDDPNLTPQKLYETEQKNIGTTH
jgi:hypothetical protein